MQFKHSRVGLYSVVTPIICEDEILKAEALKSEVVSLIEMGRNHVSADLTDLGYISSEIIGALVSLHKITARLPGEFVVVVSNENLIEILRRTGVTEVLSLVHTLKELQAKSSSIEATQKNSPGPVRKSEFDLLKQELAGVTECESIPTVPEIPLTIEPVMEVPPAKDNTVPLKEDTAFEDANFSEALEEGLLSFEAEMAPEPPAPPPPPPPAPAAAILKPEPPKAEGDPAKKAPNLAEILAAEGKEAPPEPVEPPQPVSVPKTPPVELEIRSDKPVPPPLRPASPLAGKPAMSPLASVSRQTKTNAQIVLQAPVYRSTRKTDRPVVSKKKEADDKEEKGGAKAVIIFVSIALGCAALAFGAYKLVSHFSGIKSGITNVVSTVANQESSLAQVEKAEKPAAPPPDAQQVVEEVTSPARIEEPSIDPEIKAPAADKRSKARPSQPKAPAKAEKQQAAKPAPVAERQKEPEPVREPVQAAASAALGNIFFASNPAVADIYLNGQKIGSTNVSTLDLPVGEVTLVFKKGGISLTKKVTIKPGKNESQFFYLSESAAPAPAPAYTPAEEAVSQPAPAPAVPEQAAVPAPPPLKPAAKPALAPAAPRASAKPTGKGKVFVVSMPQMADIYKDGKKIGKANESNLTFPVGPITLTLKKGKLTKTLTITVKEGDNDPVMVQME